MSSLRSQDRASLCSFTFADGRRCRTPRQSGDLQFRSFHARKQAQAQAAEDIGSDASYFFSGRYLSACDLNAALGRVFAATAQGHVKPKTASSLAYLAQVMVQRKQATVKVTTTDENGYFDMGTVNAGKYRLLASPHRGFQQPTDLKSPSGDRCELNVALQANPTDLPVSVCPIR